MDETIVPIDRAALTVTRKGWEDSLQAYQNVPASALSPEQWNECLQMAHMAFKQLEEERTTLTAPLNRDLKLVNAAFKETQAPMTALKALCGTKLGELAEAARTAAQAALAAQASAASHGSDEDLLGALQARQTAVLATRAPEATTIRRRWVPTVVDDTQVPRQYLQVDTRALEALGRQSNDTAPNVPGVTWELETKAVPTGKY